MSKSSQHSSTTLIFLLAILLAGLGLFLGQHFLFLKLQHQLEAQRENESNRYNIGELIINDLRQVEANFFRLPTTTEANAQRIFSDSITNTLARVKKALHVIERGGTIDYIIPLNLPERDEMITTIHYQPTTTERYILEIIDLRPKLISIEEKSDQLLQLVAARDSLRNKGDIEKWSKATLELKNFLKTESPNFTRLHENANQLFYNSRQRLASLEGKVAFKHRQYNNLELATASCICLIVFILIGFVYKRQNALMELEKSQEVLSLAYERFSRILDGLDNIIYVSDLETHEILFINRFAREKFGNVIGKKCFQVFPEYKTGEICPCCIDHLQFKNNNTRLGNDFICERQQGEKWLEIHGQQIIWEQERQALHVLIFDITDRKLAQQEREEIEAKLHRAQKMEAIGMMAGGVAHDLNNILAGIVTYPDILLMGLPEDSDLRKPLQTIKQAGKRAAAVVDDLLTVARGIAQKKEIITLNHVIEQYLSSPEFSQLAARFPAIKYTQNLDPDLASIKGSAIHMSKVIMNLVTNAIEAIDLSGTVSITTYNEISNSGKDTMQVVLRVSDDGPGINASDIERIFEPFYTKKAMGRSGTGLGLAVVWNTVQEHGGTVEVESGSSGTTFEIKLPASSEAPALLSTTLQRIMHGHGETILVIDDDDHQRQIATDMLSRLGYNPIVAASGEEAVSYMKKNKADLLILDMIMPSGMGGCETYKHILDIHSGQKAILVSGFSASEDVKQALRLGASCFIKKPYTVQQLISAVFKTLHSDNEKHETV